RQVAVASARTVMPIEYHKTSQNTTTMTVDYYPARTTAPLGSPYPAACGHASLVVEITTHRLPARHDETGNVSRRWSVGPSRHQPGTYPEPLRLPTSDDIDARPRYAGAAGAPGTMAPWHHGSLLSRPYPTAAATQLPPSATHVEKPRGRVESCRMPCACMRATSRAEPLACSPAALRAVGRASAAGQMCLVLLAPAGSRAG